MMTVRRLSSNGFPDPVKEVKSDIEGIRLGVNLAWVQDASSSG